MKHVTANAAMLLALLLPTFTLAQGAPSVTSASNTATAIFASGCFWCTEADFEKVRGVLKAESGYIGGDVANPTYEQVSAGNTGHAEAVRIVFDPKVVSYRALLGHFWRNVDPTVKDQQFCDIGPQYRSGIFYTNEAQQREAIASRDALLKSGKVPVIHTEITAAKTFYPAEEAHQDYYKKNPVRYNFYRATCGRDARLEALWGSK